MQLTGPFRVTGPDGQDWTPKSRKAQALLALLATSPNLLRTRSWLQSKLWSQSDTAHAGASLRQSLSALRRALGEHVRVLEASRQDVSLNSDLVCVLWDEEGSHKAGEFLEGMDLADPEFRNWLQFMRRGSGSPALMPVLADQFESRWKVVLTLDEQGAHPPLLQNFADMISRALREQGELELTENANDNSQDRLVTVTIGMVGGSEGTASVRLVANDPRLNRQIWARTLPVSVDTQDEHQNLALLGMAFQLQSELTRYLAQSRNLLGTDACPPLVLGAAIPRIFSFQPDELNQAALMLSDAMDSRNAAQFLGWQAQIAVINLIEQFTDAPEACVESGKMLAAKAIEMDPMNSVVLSTAANAQVLLERGNAAAGADLAKMAVQVNPANPLAWWAFANVAIYAGRTEDALRSARVASRLAARTPLQFWCEFQLGLAAFKAGDIATAKQALETSACLAPQFRPPRRYLLAIYADLKEHDKAVHVMAELKKLEPEFTLDRFVNDPLYPVSLVRQKKLLTWDRYQDLG
ncbi:hypothetical protein TRM7615_04029 [Falsiruegeria mediterranea M17]|uniref:Uncharacterized protein n=1 Tax=Falsiruegeria mediterranea M17 TaxID=1200281 RepID=A0A2R8CDI3_9RHOB|nr:hypothetical protein TRM7615_04029 [Falsiruegeria mediterranea M17]